MYANRTCSPCGQRASPHGRRHDWRGGSWGRTRLEPSLVCWRTECRRCRRLFAGGRIVRAAPVNGRSQQVLSGRARFAITLRNQSTGVREEPLDGHVGHNFVLTGQRRFGVQGFMGTDVGRAACFASHRFLARASRPSAARPHFTRDPGTRLFALETNMNSAQAHQPCRLARTAGPLEVFPLHSPRAFVLGSALHFATLPTRRALASCP